MPFFYLLTLMITKEKLEELTQQLIGDGELFLVELSLSSGGAIEVVVDSDSRVGIDQCVVLSRSIEREMVGLWGENIMESYSLVVTSAGIGYPLKHPRQFAKCTGKEVCVVMKSGEKINGTLTAADIDSITLKYEEKVTVEGKKRKELVEREMFISLEYTKSTSELLTIK